MTMPHPYGTPQAKRLETRFSEFRSRYDNTPYANLMLRMRRITSWLTRAEQELFEREPPDTDAAFIFYWIAFNAAYAEDRSDEYGKHDLNERTSFKEYFGRLFYYDHRNEIYNALCSEVSKEVVLSFINNKYLYADFWDHYLGIRGHGGWKSKFDAENREVSLALDRTIRKGKAFPLAALKDRALVLKTLFDRMYVFRNQMIHGAATYKGKVNREQVNDGARIMALLVPLFIELMMNNSGADWRVPNYPPIFEDKRK